tara:strand:- start:1437 stop:2198 length:762 start_codon:yes stop_codon:yes gene_type:complete
MLFRRVLEHVRMQNWTAIGIDFLIVVLGVFLGIQLGDWNESRKERAEYEDALVRLDNEMAANAASFDRMDERLLEAIKEVRAGVDALNSCSDTPENRAAVDKAIGAMTGTEGFHVRDIALRELTSDTALLRQQSDAVRARLSDLQFTTDIAVSEARFYEAKPLETSVPGLGATRIGGRAPREFPFFEGEMANLLEARGELQLAIPMEEACRDNALHAALWTWERYQANMPILSEVLRREYAETRETLDLAHPE